MLKQKINVDYITAWKGKDEQSKIAKDALNNLKSKITEAEKAKKVSDLSDEDTLKVIVNAIKQRKDSMEQFEKGGRMDLAEKEKAEMLVFEQYLPTQLTEEEIRRNLLNLSITFNNETNLMKKKGMLTGNFNKLYSGQFDMNTFKRILEEVII
jgi:hypothetical protein